MATITHNRTDKNLVRTKKSKIKKLPKWLQESLKDAEAGRVSGPFSTVEELMASLNSKAS